MTERKICTLFEDKDHPGKYHVEHVDDAGNCELATFSGPNALDRATHFAAVDGDSYYDGWKDPQGLGGE